MPPSSATRPIRPSSASISRTRWPLPSPPIAGLHDMAPTVAKRCVTSAVAAPMRAAAAAASQPAWPPPMTITSKRDSVEDIARFYRSGIAGSKQEASVSRETRRLFPDAEVTENDIEHVLHIDASG